MESLYNDLLKHANKQYDVDFVSRSLIYVKFGKIEIKKDRLRLEIFYCQSKFIIKAINNFFSLVKTISEEKVIHTKEDIASECYIVMSKCINNLKIKDLKKFSFYLNTSLNRAMYRLYEKQYKKHFDVLPNNEDTEIIVMNHGYDDHFDLTSVDLKDFSQIEIEIIKFKFSGEKLNVFLKTININNNDFQLHLENIKMKLLDLYRDLDF